MFEHYNTYENSYGSSSAIVSKASAIISFVLTSSSLHNINYSVGFIIGRLTIFIATSSQNLISNILSNYYKWCLKIITAGQTKYSATTFIFI